MRYLSTLLLFVALPMLNLNAQQTSIQTNGAQIVALPDTINLGEIYVDELTESHGKVQVKVSNTGNQPLLLRKVTGCCGTNIKQYTKAPILPGKEGVIDVEFRPEYKPQTINRTVTIESNALNKQTLKVHIVGIISSRKSSNEIEF